MERKLDALWSKAVLRRGHCAICSRVATAAHHIIHRSNKVLRHDLKNGMALCLRCHAWVHAEPTEFLAQYEWKIPEGLEERRHELLTVPYHVWMEERMKELSP